MIYYDRFWTKYQHLDPDFDEIFYYEHKKFRLDDFCADCNYGKGFLFLLNGKDIKPSNQHDLDKEIYLLNLERQMRYNFKTSIDRIVTVDSYNSAVFNPLNQLDLGEYIDLIKREVDELENIINQMNENDAIDFEENELNENNAIEFEENDMNESGFDESASFLDD